MIKLTEITMATIKSYTDIEQSCKLAVILPLESADMEFAFLKKDNSIVFVVPFIKDGYEKPDCPYNMVPCWSLAALLEQLPYEICDDDGNSAHLSMYKENDQYQLIYKDEYGDFDDIETSVHEHFVDACVAMIEKLHKLNLL